MKARSFRPTLLSFFLSLFLFAAFVAADDLKSRAEGGDAEAQYQLGLCYLTGTCRAKQFSAAAKWFRLAAEQGHVEPTINSIKYRKTPLMWASESGNDEIIRLLLQMGADPDISASLEPYVAPSDMKSRAEHGYAEAQYQLGLCYLTGTCRDKRLSEATKWFRLAAEQGYVEPKINSKDKSKNLIDPLDAGIREWLR